VNVNLLEALCGLILVLALVMRTARAHLLLRRDRRDAAEHASFVHYYSRIRLAEAQQAADPAIEETLRRFALKVSGSAPYQGKHRLGDGQLQDA
jgi:hypothetical protein